MGHLVTADGLKPDPEKIEAVCNMPKPSNVKAVRRFCCFVTTVPCQVLASASRSAEAHTAINTQRGIMAVAT